MAPADASAEPRANLIAGAFGPAARGARFAERAHEPELSWPQSSAEDVAAARGAAEAARAAWQRTGFAARAG